MSIKKFILNSTTTNNLSALEILRQKLKSKSSYSSMLPFLLAACGGGGGGRPPPPPPPPPPTPDFTESPTNTFTARDNNNRTLSEGNATADLTVVGKSGNDTITTGSGNDVIEGAAGNDTINAGAGSDVIDGGAGNDTINAGAGNDLILGGAGSDIVSAGDGDDIIVLIGVTTASQYSGNAITNPAGTGTDLSTLLALSDINDHSTSDVVSGETIDGGAGSDTLVIYGDTDISGISVSNVSTIWVNSTLTLTAAQLSAMTVVTGDGTSVLNIVGNSTGGVFDQVDLSAIDLTGIGSITSEGNVELLVSDASQLAGISEIITSGSLIVSLMFGGENNSINLSDILDVILGDEQIVVPENSILVLDTVEAVIALGQVEITGGGAVFLSGEVAAQTDSLSNIDFREVLVSASLLAGQDYLIGLTGFGHVTITDEFGNYYPYGRNYIQDHNSQYFRPEADGVYFFIAGGTNNTFNFSLTEFDANEPDGSQDISLDSSRAAILEVDAPLVNNISFTNDEDMYAVDLIAGVVYQLDVTGLSSSGGTLENPSLRGLTTPEGLTFFNVNEISDEDSGVGLDAQSTFMVRESGTYYFVVNSDGGGLGTYTVSLTESAVTEPDGSAEIGNTLETAIAVVDGDIVDGSLGFINDEDWFSITMTAGDVYTLTVDWDGDYINDSTQFRPMISNNIYTVDGFVLSSGFTSTSDTSFTMQFEAEADNTYYFTIESNQFEENENYQLNVTKHDTSEPDGSPDIGETIDTALTVIDGDVIEANLSYFTDTDMFEISMMEGEMWDLSLIGWEDGIHTLQQPQIIKVYDASGALVLNTSVTMLEFIVPADGNYYFEISTGAVYTTGTYQLTAVSVDITEPDGSGDYGNTPDTAVSYAIGDTLNGTISYEYDADWLAIDLVAGQSYTWTLSSYNADGTPLSVGDIHLIEDPDGFQYFGTEGENISTNDTDTFTFTAHINGTYNLLVDNGASAQSGDYTITSQHSGLDEPDGSADISAAIDTTATITVGTAVTGGVGLEYDRDWYAVDFIEGNVYQITLTGDASGTGTLVDPRIEWVYDENGVGLPGAYNDDGFGASRESFMLFTAPYTGTFYIAAGGWENEAGTYELTVTDVSSTHTGDLQYGPTNMETITEAEIVNLSGNPLIDGLIFGTRYVADPDGVSTTITYSIPATNTYYSDRPGFGYDGNLGELGSEPWVSFTPLTPEQIALYQSFVTHLTSFVNINMVQVSDSEGSAGTVRIAWTGIEDNTIDAWAYFPLPAPWGGDIWLFSNSVDDPLDDNYINYLYLHETGHALGLSHTFEGLQVMPDNYDSHQWSVMAYNFHTSYTNATFADLYPQTYMYADILALQYLYGAIETNLGDDTYTFDGNARYYMTIWDNGGNDTIEFVNQNAGVEIYLSGVDQSELGGWADFVLSGGSWLNVGTIIQYSNSGSESATVFIPEEITIENLYGTQFDDHLYGNNVDNYLRGLDGGDVLFGSAGNDILDGGSGEYGDVLVGGSGNDTFVTREGDGSLNIANADMVLDFSDGEDSIGLNGLTFDDLTITAGTGNETGNTVIQITATGEYLMVLDNIDSSLITAEDFTTIADEWWLA